MLNYVNNDFYEAVGEDYERYMAEVQIDRQVYEDAGFVETSLKLNGVDDGMVAYSRVVGLLLQWYCQQ